MRFIELNPDKHDQANWANQCSTAFCYAGHAAILAGATQPPAGPVQFGMHWAIDPETHQSTRVPSVGFANTNLMAVDEFAAARLGITAYEADALFDGDRTIAQLRVLVDALCDGAWIDNEEYVHIDDNEYEYVDYWLDGRDA